MIDLHGVPSRKPPESPLAPQWYRLESKTGNKAISGIPLQPIECYISRRFISLVLMV